jgi:carnitine O-acetyltransferase
LDGTTIVDFVDFLFKDAVRETLNAGRYSNLGTPACTPVTFTLNEVLHDSILSAGNAFNQLAQNTASTYFSFDDFGANHIKSLKLSPDAFVQLGFQLAHFRTKGLIGATYESVSSRHFERGRTEAMRVVTPEIVAFVNSMQDTKSDHASRYLALRAAAEQHTLRLRQCQNGEAPEQHLWQLLLIAQQHGKTLGTGDHFKLFESPGWLKMRSDYLSTSSAPSDNITVFGFGPTSEQCIGIGYLVRNDSIKAYLSTPSSVANHMHAFAEHLHNAFRDMGAVLRHEQV